MEKEGCCGDSEGEPLHHRDTDIRGDHESKAAICLRDTCDRELMNFRWAKSIKR